MQYIVRDCIDCKGRGERPFSNSIVCYTCPTCQGSGKIWIYPAPKFDNEGVSVFDSSEVQGIEP